MKLHFDHKNIDEARFPILFSSLVLFFIGMNSFVFIEEQIRVNILITIVLGASIFTVSANKKMYYTAIFAAVLFLFLRNLSETKLSENYVFISLSVLFLFVFMGLIFRAILKYLLECKNINQNVIFGVISGYLMIGILFTFLFVFLFTLNPEGTINFKTVPGFADFLYFSMITLSTVGYGDIVPLSDLARLAGYSLGIIGQLYVGIVMALIIGKFLQSK